MRLAAVLSCSWVYGWELPPRLTQFLKALAGGEAIQRSHAIDDQDAIKVITFVLPDSGRKSFALNFKGIAFKILRTNTHTLGPTNVDLYAWNAQAPFLLAHHLPCVLQDRIDEDPRFASLLGSRIGNEESNRLTHLGSRQANPIAGVHHFDHGFSQLAKRGIEGLHPARLPEKNRIGPNVDSKLAGLRIGHEWEDASNTSPN